MKLLVVDDANYILEQTRQFLKDEDSIEIFEASTALEALDSFKSEKQDLLIIDAVMPSMSGVELIKMIKKLNSSVNIIGLSTQVRGATCAKLSDAGANKILKKPFTKQTLLTTLKEYL